MVKDSQYKEHRLEHPGESFGDYLYNKLRKHSTSSTIPAQVFSATGEELTFPEFLKLAVRAALGLRALGLGRGDTIAFYSRNTADLFPTLVGALFEGITTAFINPVSTEDEVRFYLSLVEAKAILSESGFNSHKATHAMAPGMVHLLSGVIGEVEGTAVPLRKLWSLGVAAQEDPEAYQPVRIPDFKEHLVVVLFSSGTTGLPKAVGHSNYGYLLNCLDPRTAWGVHPGQRVLITSWLSWSTGLTMSILSMLRGSTRVVSNYSTPQDIAVIMERFQVNTWFIAPPVLVLFADAVRAMAPRPDLSSLRAVITGGVSLSAETQRFIMEAVGVPVLQVYGSSEVGVVTADLDPPRPGSSGLPAAGSLVRLVDLQSGRDVEEPSALGEIRLKNPFSFKQYIGNPEATAKSFDEQGYYCSGDLGHRDADGYLYVVDRIKELIKYSSWEMAPAELEGVLLSHPDVLEACVVGTPDPRAGDLPTAFVVRRPASAVTERQLQELVEGRLSDFKRLRGGVFFEEGTLRKCSNGKLDRKHYRTRLIQENNVQSVLL